MFNSQNSVIQKGAKQLQNYWASVDQDLKDIKKTMDHNFSEFGKGLELIDKRIEGLEKKLDAVIQKEDG